MFEMFAHRRHVLRLASGAVLLLFGLVWLWPWHVGLSELPSPVLDHPFSIALCVASLAAAGWLVLRSRVSGNKTPATGGGGDQPPSLVTADPAVDGEGAAPATADDGQSLRLLAWIGGVASAALLVGLVMGDLISVVYALALAGVVVAFLFIVAVVPRGLVED
jgi:hypothetical protein